MFTLAVETLVEFCHHLFEAAGVPRDEAAVVARSLVEANRSGHDSHGVMRVPQYVQALREGKLRAGVGLDVIHETAAALAADANWGLGQVQAHRLLDRIIPKARLLGIAIGTLRHCGHTGRLGEYGERLAAEGLVLLATVNSHGLGRRVAPPGGTEARLSTNPLCLAAPTADPAAPLVLDIGTSVRAEGKVRGYYQRGEPVPPGWLLDAAGQPTTDPAVLYTEPRGSILPLGGPQAYKGFGLALLLDALAGGLSGGLCSRDERTQTGTLPAGIGNAAVFIVIDPNLLAGSAHFVSEVHTLAQFVRGCPVRGSEVIMLPGDPERTARLTHRQYVSIVPPTWQQLTALAESLGVSVPVPVPMSAGSEQSAG
jgi:uncharacterized oxidoreductase